MYEYFISLAYDLPGLPALESNLLAAATVLEFTQANCTWRIWEYFSKASLKDSQQSNVVPTLKRCSSISRNCTDNLRHNNKMYPKKHIRLRQSVPPQRKPQRIPRQGGLLPMRKRALCCDWLIAALRIASRCHISLFVEQLCE